MNSLTQNKFLLGLLLITLLALGVGIWLIMKFAGRSGQAFADFESKKGEYEKLISAPLYPSSFNEGEWKSRVAKYSENAEELRDSLLKGQHKLDTGVTEQMFDKNLKQAVKDVLAKAVMEDVTIDEKKFFLGLGRYQKKLPLRAAAPYLDFEKDACVHLSNLLIDSGVTSIEMLDCGAIPQESEKKAEPVDKKNRGKVQVDPAEGIVERYPIELNFTGKADAFQKVFDGIVNSKEFFFVVKDFRFENEHLVGLDREDYVPEVERDEDEDEEGGEEVEEALQEAVFVFGTYNIRAAMRLDLVRLSAPKTEAN